MEGIKRGEGGRSSRGVERGAEGGALEELARGGSDGAVGEAEVAAAGSGGCAGGVSQRSGQEAAAFDDGGHDGGEAAASAGIGAAGREPDFGVVRAPDEGGGRVAAAALPARAGRGGLRAGASGVARRRGSAEIGRA